MTKRYQKSKGSQFEYECAENLQRLLPDTDVYLTKERGFKKQFDIELVDKDIPEKKTAIECKKHKSISWSQARKLLDKLIKATPEHDDHWLIFTYNRQPVLVMEYNGDDELVCCESEDFFGGEWIRR